MKPHIALQTHCARTARVFGSVLSGQDKEGSDLDLLIDTTPETSLVDVAAIQFELKKLLGIRADVLTPNSLPEKFCHQVIAQAMPL